MTDKEIVIALQKCNNGKGHRCSECPALGKYNHRICKATIDKLAVNLIERLQSENTRLKADLERTKDECRQLDKNAAGVMLEYITEIDRLKSDIERVTAERDKAVEDMRRCRRNKCDYCYYSNKNQNTPCRDCQSPISNCGDKWQWRGLEESKCEK